MTRARPDAIVVAKANAGVPQWHEEHIHYSGTPELMAIYAGLAVDAGARIVGGCCGTKPAHLAAMRRALDMHAAGPRPLGAAGGPGPGPPLASPRPGARVTAAAEALHFEVGAEHVGERLDRFLSRSADERQLSLSRTRLKALIEAGGG